MKTTVTPQDVKDEIVDETYTVLPNGRTTVCQLTLKNGFTVEGQSACVDIANFNKELGQKIAREMAVEKIWPLLGFRLADKLAEKGMTFQERLVNERAELSDKIEDLAAFLDKGAPLANENQITMLRAQYRGMQDYLKQLDLRIQDLEV